MVFTVVKISFTSSFKRQPLNSMWEDGKVG